MDMRQLVGKNFSRIRQERGLTQQDVEERSGFSQQYLSGLEQGQRNPTIISLYEIAQALDVGILDLLQGASGHSGRGQQPLSVEVGSTEETVLVGISNKPSRALSISDDLDSGLKREMEGQRRVLDPNPVLSAELLKRIEDRLEKCNLGLHNRGRDISVFVEAVLWQHHTRQAWRHLPKKFGKWNTVYKRYRDWKRLGIFDDLE